MTNQKNDFDDASILEQINSFGKLRERLMTEIGRVVVGREEVLEELLVAIFAGGHCVLLAVPGLAKTLMVRKLAETLSLDFQRIQFTPDLMPTDITGAHILEEDPATGGRCFRYQKGPVFTHILLADEINRTPPKTQAALLEAMQEEQVTAGREIYRLPDPFAVLATQNPVEHEGTYVLPEAQLDRFMFMVKMGYSSKAEEHRILTTTTRGTVPALRPIVDRETVLRVRSLIWNVPVSDHVVDYVTRLMRATRPEDGSAPDFIEKYVTMGCSPRAGQAMLGAVKANAVLTGRTDVACEDVRRFILPAMRHRILLNFAATSEGLDTDAIIRELLDAVPEVD